MSVDKPIQGIADFKAAAAMGDGYAQSQLGYFSMQGIPGVLDADPQAGVEWIRKSAAQGNEVGKAYLKKAEAYLRDHPQDDVKPVYKKR